MELDILVSGASIAGPCVAALLGAQGHRVTVVERAPRPRPGGQAIDVRGPALRVLEELRILDHARALRTQMKGVSAVDADGVELWKSDEKTLSGGRFDAGDLEILRDDLAMLLLQRIANLGAVLYDETIMGMDERSDGIHVRFRRSPAQRFDLVIGADGLRSTVRNLAFGDDKAFVHSLGVALAVFTVPNFLALRDWQISHREARGGFLLYTARDNRELRVTLGFPLEQGDDRRMGVDEQKRLVATRCGAYRWVVPRLLDAMWTAPDFYYGTVAQVKMDRWAKGRVVLVGDAAFCPSPFSGQGTSLALIGAYVLADELRAQGTALEAACRRYHDRMRHFVEVNQALATRDLDDPGGEAMLDSAKNAIRLDAAAVAHE